MLLESIDEAALGGEDLATRRVHVKPGGAVDLGKRLHLRRAWRPLELEGVAGRARDIEVAGHSPGVHDLSSRLPHLAQRSRVSLGRRGPELFEKFAPCHVDAYLIVGELAFRYRPDALVTSLPERTAWMNKENLELAI